MPFARCRLPQGSAFPQASQAMLPTAQLAVVHWQQEPRWRARASNLKMYPTVLFTISGTKKTLVHSASKRFLTCAGIWGEMGRAGTVLCAVCFSFWVTFYYILSHKSELLVPPASYDPACHDIADELQCRKSWKGCTWVSSNAQGSSRCFQPGLPIIQSSTIYISQNEINIPSE